MIDLFRGGVRRTTVLTIVVCATSLSAWWAFMFWHAQHLRNLPELATWMVPQRERLVSQAFFLVISSSIVGNFFAGALETETIPGWGFDRYILRQLGPMAGTLMAVDPNAPQVERFISLGGEARLLRYNSRLPLVVYVPAGVEVRYRLWRAESNAARAEPG